MKFPEKWHLCRILHSSTEHLYHRPHNNFPELSATRLNWRMTLTVRSLILVSDRIHRMCKGSYSTDGTVFSRQSDICSRTIISIHVALIVIYSIHGGYIFHYFLVCTFLMFWAPSYTHDVLKCSKVYRGLCWIHSRVHASTLNFFLQASRFYSLDIPPEKQNMCFSHIELNQLNGIRMILNNCCCFFPSVEYYSNSNHIFYNMSGNSHKSVFVFCFLSSNFGKYIFLYQKHFEW